MPQLRLLAEQRLRRTFNEYAYGLALSDDAIKEVIEVIHAVDEQTSAPVASGRGLWAIILPALQAKIAVLLGNEAFKELLLELSALNFALLAMLDTKVHGPASQTVVYSPPDGDEEDFDGGFSPHPVRGDPRYGQGRRLG